MAAIVVNIKNNIKAILNKLKNEETLRDVQVDDFKTNIFERNFSAFPCAILTTPSIENDALTSSQNIRLHTFEVVVILSGDEVTDPTQVEELIETIINKFDSDPTLKGDGTTGVADGGVEPSSSTPEAVVSRGRQLIAFSIFIRARAVKDLTFV